MIKVSNLCKSYGSQELFRNASFNINPKERVGLVGRNGHGKTTLFRLILGLEAADSGSVSVPKNYRMGYLEQHLDFTSETVLQEACLGLPPGREHEAWRAEKILAGLGFGPQDMHRAPSEFSGGFQVRLNLAKVLVSESEMLLLDEPTNYLDVVSIRWLTRFLHAWPGELMLITHDRSFMDSVTTHTLAIHRKRLKKIKGSTEKLYNQIAAEEEIYEKTRLNDEKRRKEVEQFIRRFRAKARLANLVQSRIKTLQKQELKDKLEKMQTLEFSFKSVPFGARMMMEVSDLSFGYGAAEPNLFADLNLAIHKNDRICVVGKNGKGKTTLLKLLAGVLRPGSGKIKPHPSVQIGYFEQTNSATLDPNKTIEQEIMATSRDCTQQKARDIAGAMMFSGEQALKQVSVLSGGEKSRVLLAKLLVSPCHLLLLDEPTNHLDMEACDSLMAAIDCFDGAVVLVTHNEMFLHTLADRLLVFDRGKQFLYESGYQSFLDDVGWENDEHLEQPRKAATSQTLAPEPFDKKTLRKLKAQIVQERSRVLKPLEQRNAELERAIAALEEQLTEVNKQLIVAATNGDGQGLADLARKERETKRRIDAHYAQLDEVLQALETRAREFEEKLEKLHQSAKQA
ncbi:MAG: ATP-binding cassette domain-containing protein [bacterium]